jgi:tripeptide aminopeptidase
MKKSASAISKGSAVRHLMDFLSLEGMSGEETAVVDAVRRKLIAAGCPASRIRTDQAHRRIAPSALSFATGNLIVRFPGTRREPRRLFLSHMDTVPLCRGAVPVRRGREIRARGETAVRADNRTGVAALVTIAEEILRGKWPHPPLTFLFTIAEENGLYGSKHVRPEDLGRPAMAFNYDSGDPNELIVGAIGATKWEADIRGLSAHAGMHPENGISALLIFSKAVADLAAHGYFGRICKGRRTGTANVGIVKGGEATNQVTDRVLARGECRSHDPAFLREIQKAYADAFQKAARSVRNAQGRSGSVTLSMQGDYAAFRLAETSPEVRFAQRVATGIGLRPRCVRMDGGLDANPLVAAGIPTLTLGAGQHGAHSIEERVDLDEFLDGCRLGLALATEPWT